MTLNIRRLVESGISPQAAKELQAQFDSIAPSDDPKEVPKVEDSEATTVAALREDFNELLDALREVGFIQ